MAVFPGTLEPLLGVDYGSFDDAWGVSRLKFEVYTLGTLGVIVLIGVIGYAARSADTRGAAHRWRSGTRASRLPKPSPCKVAAWFAPSSAPGSCSASTRWR